MELRRAELLVLVAGRLATEEVVLRSVRRFAAARVIDDGRAGTSLEVRADRVLRRVLRVSHAGRRLDLVGRSGRRVARVGRRAADRRAVDVAVRARAEVEIADGEVLVGAGDRHVGDRRRADGLLRAVEEHVVRAHVGRARRGRRRGEGEERGQHEAEAGLQTHAVSLGWEGALVGGSRISQPLPPFIIHETRNLSSQDLALLIGELSPTLLQGRSLEEIR